jgi:hypothetical protein
LKGEELEDTGLKTGIQQRRKHNNNHQTQVLKFKWIYLTCKKNNYHCGTRDERIKRHNIVWLLPLDQRNQSMRNVTQHPQILYIAHTREYSLVKYIT